MDLCVEGEAQAIRTYASAFVSRIPSVDVLRRRTGQEYMTTRALFGICCTGGQYI